MAFYLAIFSSLNIFCLLMIYYKNKENKSSNKYFVWICFHLMLYDYDISEYIIDQKYVIIMSNYIITESSVVQLLINLIFDISLQ